MGRRKVGLVFCVWAFLLLVAVFGVVLNVPLVKGDKTIYKSIYIRADGSVDPPETPITSVDNVTYTFTDNIITGYTLFNSYFIVVLRDNIVIDGAGYTLQGLAGPEDWNINSFGTGIRLSGRSNVTVKNLTVKGFYKGISLSYSSNCSITENNINANRDYGIGIYGGARDNNITGNYINANRDSGISVSGPYHGPDPTSNVFSRNNITNNGRGLGLGGASNTLLRNNTMAGNDYNFGVTGHKISHFLNDVDSSNTVDSKPIYYWVSRQNMEVPSDAGFVALVNSNNITAKGVELKSNIISMVLVNTTNSLITNNEITNNIIYGIYLYNSSHNTLSENDIRDNGGGVYLRSSNNSRLSKNNITQNNVGVMLEWSCYNTISGNKIANNTQYGVGVWYSSNYNNIYHNNFISNAASAGLNENVWDDGYPSGGNYWSDYTGVDEKSGPNQDQSGSDGIGDTPYIIDANNRDSYPLTNPWAAPFPVAKFTHSPYVPLMNETITFDASASYDSDGAIETFTWNFGDGNVTSLTTPTITHAYAAPGFHTVNLTVTDNDGLNGSTTKPVRVWIEGEPLTVDDDGPADFSKIQDAIDTAIQGDMIFVYNGTYYENVVVDKSNLTLVGESPSTTVIDGGGTGSVVTVTVGRVKISNFTIQHATYGVTVAIMGKVVIENNKISSNSESGIMIIDQSNVLIKNNTIKQNKNGIATDASNTHSGIAIVDNSILSNQGNGVYLYSYSYSPYSDTYPYIYDINITGNVISSNQGNGVYLYSYSYSYNPDYSHSYSYIYDINITNNTISSNRENGIYLHTYSFSTSYTQYSGSYSYSYIYDINMTGNTISSNQGNGVYLHSYSYSSSSSSSSSHPYIYGINITSNTISSNQRNGIYLYSESSPYSKYSYSDSYIYDINVTGNVISSNKENGVYLTSCSHTVYSEYSSSDSYIYDISITSNTISSNQRNGVYLYSYSGYSGSDSYSYIYNISMTDNTISSNKENGIHLTSYSHIAYPEYTDSNSYIYDINVTGNVISSNKDIGIYNYAKNHTADIKFDLLFTQNKIHSNSQGILIEGGIIANLTQNSIASNINEGILFNTTQNNEAHHNDIYGNGYGMKVSHGATVDAERNYWGDSSGPYHESLNPDGEGNSVNGNGTDLDFIPFLTNPVDSTPPTTLQDYDGLWHATHFTITLTATDDMNGVAETYYIINNGATQNVTAYGQPLIITESANNTLEYWSVDNVGNEELPHKILTEIKLDKTAPAGSISINNDATYTTSTSVTLNLTSTDTTSGVYQVRYSNDGVWDTEPWEDFSTTKAWTLTSGDETKTVYYQIKDNTGLISVTYSDTIILGLDTDVDGVPDIIDPDDDNDGVNDDEDAFPLDPTEWFDTDGDGTGNNADDDDDNDGTLDVNDAFPLDPTESVDTDGDGVGDKADTDDDNDGVLDIDDVFPLDSTESIDTDNDGVGNNADTDDDNDGVNDDKDALPLDPAETVDTDGDGIGNNADIDDDNDGLPDTWETENELNPLDTADASLDPDGDGLTNLQEYQGDTDPNISDAQPFPWWILGAAAAVIIGIAVAATFLWKRRK